MVSSSSIKPSSLTSRPPSPSAQSIRRRKALADALAGVVATLVSLWTFYPIDVLKTKLQAGTDDDDNKNKNKNNNNLLWTDPFRGLPLKTLHAASSSFCYFYLYSSIASWWTAHYGTTSSGRTKKMSPAVRLSLSALAAMMNTLLTLPLDVLASQKQASTAAGGSHCNEKYFGMMATADDTQDESESSSNSTTEPDKSQQRMDSVWKQLQLEVHAADEHDGDVFYDSCFENCPEIEPCENVLAEDLEEEKKSEDGDENCTARQQVSVTFTVADHPNVTTSNSNKLRHLETQSTSSNSWSSCDSEDAASSSPFSFSGRDIHSSLSPYTALWKGLHPSLLLCSNPSIHYTVFDMAKTYLLQSRTGASSTDRKTNLSMTEAFLLGLFAKFCATMATYPLIRAKVMLMVTSRKSMSHTLLSIYNQDGIGKGWYKGCSVQLLHTVLKSALLMMVKEGISSTTHRMLVPPQQQQ